jgi:hypothetical protein
MQKVADVTICFQINTKYINTFGLIIQLLNVNLMVHIVTTV